MRRFKIIVLAALAAVLLGTFLAYWLNPPVKLPVLDDGKTPEAITDGRPRVQGLTYNHVEQGVRKWTLSASGARIDEAKKEVALSTVRLKFYPEGGGWITLEGDEGIYNQNNHHVSLKGTVKGRTHDGLTLRTESISYDEQKQLVQSQAPVTITGPSWRVKGRRMTVWVPQSKIRFTGDVDSLFTPKGSGPPPGATLD